MQERKKLNKKYSVKTKERKEWKKNLTPKVSGKKNGENENWRMKRANMLGTTKSENGHRKIVMIKKCIMKKKKKWTKTNGKVDNS